MLVRTGESIPKLTVFCPYLKRSIDVSECTRCTNFVDTSQGALPPVAELVCQAAHGPSAEPPPDAPPATFAALAAGHPVADALPRIMVCAERDVSLDTAFGQTHFIAVPVVDANRRFLGMAWRPGIARPGVGPAELAVERRLLETCGLSDAVVGAFATRSTPVLLETGALSEAFERMAFRHERLLPVVDQDEVLVGTLSDLDLLSWFGHMKADARRPPIPAEASPSGHPR